MTHVTVVVHRDEDYPLSRGLRIFYPYDRDRLERPLDVTVQMVNDNSFPADYDYSVSALSSGSVVLPSFSPNIDYTMRTKYPEIFGQEGQFLWPNMIIVYAQWANLGGQDQPYNSAFFNEIKEAGGEHSTFRDEIADAGGHVLQSLFLGAQVDDDKHRPLSELMGDWTFTNVVSSRNLISSVYSCLIPRCLYRMVGRMMFVIAFTRSKGTTTTDATWRCRYSTSRQQLTGLPKHGRKHRHQLEGFKHLLHIGLFYDNTPSAQQVARTWQQENDACVGHPGAVFCAEDRRVFCGSHDLDLDQERRHYFDDETKYRRLCGIKARVDPDSVFTPDGFCVGAPPVAAAVIGNIGTVNNIGNVGTVNNIQHIEMAARLRERRREHETQLEQVT